MVEFAGGASEAGKKMVVAALDGDANRNGFDNVLGLIPLAESVVKLSAVCMSCANEAPFTKRISLTDQVLCNNEYRLADLTNVHNNY